MMPLIGWMKMLSDRYLTDDAGALPLARELYEVMKQYPILSPHGHIDPKVILENKAYFILNKIPILFLNTKILKKFINIL